MKTKIKQRRKVRFSLRCGCIGFAAIALAALFANAALKVQGQDQQPSSGGVSQPASADTNQVAPPQVAPPASQPASNDFFTPFPPPNQNKPQPPPQPPPPVQVQPAAPRTNEEVSLPTPTLPPPTLLALKPKKNEVSVSGDFMLGEGTVTLPLLYSLHAKSGSFTPTVAKPTRSSDYFGATLSYSYGQAWYFDLSYSQGNSSGSQSMTFPGHLGSANSSFSIDDDWYQAYVRYTFPGLRGKRLSAYLRAGVTYIQSTLDDTSILPPGVYTQNDKATDIRGNLGAGLGYNIYSSRRFRFGLDAEGEGFFGKRSQDSLETLNGAGPTVSINNTLYGGIGRAVAHFEYRFGRTGLLRCFLDGGAEVDYTMISYPSAGTPNELLWGPYVKFGLRYSF